MGLPNHQKQKEVPLDHIIVENGTEEGAVFDVGALVEELQQVTDRRQKRGRRYSLPFLLAVIVLAKLSGQNKPSGIAEWVQLRRKQLVVAFNRQRETVPSLNTIRRTLAQTVIVTEMQTVLNRYLHQEYGGQRSVLVTIDGKTMRGTIPIGMSQGVHLLAAYLPAEGVVLMQVAVAAKENEIAAAPEVLMSLDLRGRVVSGDAMFTQRDLSVQVLYQGGDYIWFVKDNQPRLKADVVQFFVPPRKAPGWQAPAMPQDVAQKTQKGHGRLEQRTMTVIPDEVGFIDWPGLQQVFKLERKVTHLATNQVTVEIAYGITSLAPERASASRMLALTQSHWGIENGLHYRRDVTLLEDATRISSAYAAQAMAVLNNFIIGLTNKLGLSNLASAQRIFEAKLTLTLSNYA
jgi:predicted transposase YbfD/YdcC